MAMRFISGLLVTVAIVLANHASARPQTAFDNALENGDYKSAANEIGKLPLKGGPKGQLDSYYGRFLAAGGLGQTAEPYLVRAIAATADATYRDELKFELARAHEVDGLVERAEADYRSLAKNAEDAAIRRRALLSLARLRLGATPDEAIALLQPLTTGETATADRWEAHLLLSRAYAIAGRAREASTALSEAWLEAPKAAEPAKAISITAMDMGVDRIEAGGRGSDVGLLAMGGHDVQFSGLSQLPVCDDKVRPEDRVIVAIQADERQRPIYSAVRASRPGIAQLFTVPIAVATQRIAGAAVYVTLRCRTSVDPDLRFANGVVRNLPLWLAQQGQYFPLGPIDPNEGDPITQLKQKIQDAERRLGVTSPALTPTLMQLSLIEAAQGRLGNSAQFAEGKALADRALAILTEAGAPADVLEQIRVQTTVGFAQNTNIEDVAGPAALRVMNFLASQAETTPVQSVTAARELNGWRLRPTQRLAVIDRLIAFLDERRIGPRDPMRQAAELRRANILREIGTVAGMQDRLAAGGVAKDLCRSADRPPSVPPAAITITSEDYPKDLLHENLAGLTTIEMAPDASGNVRDQRIIVSQPPGLFDAVTLNKLRTVTMIPAQQGERPIACRGMLQNVRWVIPYQTWDPVPFADWLPSSEQ